jgi:hypothetical protein
MSNPLTRREFLGTSVAAGGALLAAHLAQRAAIAAEEATLAQLPPVKIYKVYVGRTGEFYMARPTEEIAKFEKYFADLEQKLGDVKFIGGDIIPPTDAGQVAQKMAEADAAILIHLSGHGGDAPVLGKLIDVGLPTAVFAEPFGGHGWMYFPKWHKEHKKVVLLPTTDWGELDRVVGLMRVPVWMKQTRILVVGPPRGTADGCSAEVVKKKLGAELVMIPNTKVLVALQAIYPMAAVAVAEQYWISQAKEVVEPKRDEIINSARMFLAVREMMIKEKAQAVTSSHCMGSPRCCFTFSKLNDLGLVGACEGDMDSTLTMLIFAYAFRAPGFISDPVFDTAKNALIHFHCTSATKMDGPGGARLPFRIRDQTDTKGGAALEVAHRVGQVVTCAKLVNCDTMVISTGKIIEIGTSPMACRTQFTTEVKDARRMFLNWGADAIQGGVMTLLHRVVFYGDHMQSIADLADLMGFKVIEEGGAA